MEVKHKFKEKDLVLFPLNQSYCPGIIKSIATESIRVQSLITGRLYITSVTGINFINLTVKYLI